MRAVRRVSLAAAAAITLGAGALVAAPAYAATVTTTEVGITYQADNADVAGGATITAFDGSTTTVTIPATVDIGGTNYDVVAIADGTGITGAGLHGGVFAGYSLTDVSLGENLQTIGSYAFRANDLGSITFPDSVTSIGMVAFANTNLTGVDFGSSLTTISNGAFALNQLTSVVLPPSVTTLDVDVFAMNGSLASVEFTGPAPTTISPAGSDGSFSTMSGALVVTYPGAFDASQAPGGFTSPTWQGYASQARDSAVSITKTVDATFRRSYDWTFEKSGAVADVRVGDTTAVADLDFTVTATPNGYDDRSYVLTGTITVTNETDEFVDVNAVVDQAEVGVPTTCSLTLDGSRTNGQVGLEGQESLTFDYRCRLDGTPTDGTNTATATWTDPVTERDQSASVTEPVSFTQRTASFETVTIGDDRAIADGEFVQLGTATWNSDQYPTTFEYTLTRTDLPIGECTTVTNTAIIFNTEETTDATVEICPEQAVVTPPTTDPTPEATPTIEPDPSGLALTGANVDGGIIAIAVLLLLAGGTAVMVSRRRRDAGAHHHRITE